MRDTRSPPKVPCQRGGSLDFRSSGQPVHCNALYLFLILFTLHADVKKGIGLLGPACCTKGGKEGRMAMMRHYL